MSNVIGPINEDDWYTMRQLRESVRFMKTADPKKYELAINKESQFYDELLRNNARAA